MPRKPKKTPVETSAPDNTAATDQSPAKPRRAAAPSEKKDKATSPKAAAASAAKLRKGKAEVTAAAPTDAEIQLRAYFIAERRHRLHLSGDASSDWLDAKRQLLAEGREE